MDLGDALKLIGDEYIEASMEFPKFNSFHEGYSILKEEVDELWEEIKNKNVIDNIGDDGKISEFVIKPDVRQIEKEAVQVGAMAVRFLIDLCGDKK